MDIELHDWEVLDDSNSDQNTTYIHGIERDSEGIIRSDYFSIDYQIKYAPQIEDVSDKLSVESDNPSWIDPVSDTNYTKTKPIGELWTSDGSSSDDGKFHELDMVDVENRSDSGEIESNPRNCEMIDEETERSKTDNDDVLRGNVGVESDERKRVGVWWKLPLDLLKYCLFKASPMWSLSVAAAMMGVVILGRRLYKMKQKTRTLQLKVAVDDKISQVMSRAAKLNESFSVVKRAPIIRPALPGTGITPWPMMAIR
ncbi:uncharacterized protein [Rutidosis leptorrhynchoides]|uniref:uncharacterized protein isoform X2 n=1 Tax=Rutidosis leptorrhynchoides TaxID=125765 RepID=UPI003A99001C